MKKIKRIYEIIVVDNFFYYLKNKEITQKKYAADCNMDETILSKWKSGSSSPTLDQVKQAAQYFDITVNDLVYSEIEKKNLEVLSDKSYDPIIAQQSIRVKQFYDFFKRPLKIAFYCLISFSFLIFVVYLFRNVSAYFSLIILLGVPLVAKAIYKFSFIEKTYIINYLDDIFYRRNDATNKYYYLSLFIQILSLLSIFYYSSLFIDIETANSIQNGLFISLVFSMMMLIGSSISAIINLPKEFKAEIYDNELDAFNSSKYLLIVHFAISSIAILFCITDLQTYYIFLIASIGLLCINVLNFSIMSKEYAKYTLVYQEDNKEPRELFPKKN